MRVTRRALLGWLSVLASSGRRGDASSRLARSCLAVALIATIAPAGCGSSKSASPTNSSRASCRAPSDVLAGVYHPDRLHVLSPCRRASGTVVGLSHERDGDLHIALDTGGALVNAVNVSDLGGSLVVEFMPRDGGHLPAPSVREHISVTGAWVLDANHGWNELHPVWSETLAGITHHSGPQYGGSPADVGSGQAAADCTSNGSVCRGYGGRRMAR